LQVNKINNVKLYNCAIGNSELKINIKESNFGNSTTGETEGVIVETKARARVIIKNELALFKDLNIRPKTIRINLEYLGAPL
jgi:hypothetical protein